MFCLGDDLILYFFVFASSEKKLILKFSKFSFFISDRLDLLYAKLSSFCFKHEHIIVLLPSSCTYPVSLQILHS